MIKRLEPKDLDSIFSFKSWIREAVPRHEDDILDDSTLLIYLDYIRELILKDSSIPQREWLALVNKIKDRMSKI